MNWMTTNSSLPDAPLDGPTVSGKVRILMVEDEPGDAALARIALRRSDGFEMHQEGTLAGAVVWLKSQPCDVLLLDLGLPDSSGFATISAAREAAPTLPIIVLTGHDDSDFALAALEAGAQDYLIKGDFTGGSLQRAIRYAITRKALEERVRSTEHQLRVIFSLTPEAILVLSPDHRVALANPAAETLFGTPAETLTGMAAASLLEGLEGNLEGVGVGTPHQGEGMAHRGDALVPVEFSIALMPGERQNSFLLVIQDVSQRKAAEAELKRLAVTDPLTGLPNRRRFMESCESEMMRFKRYDVPGSMLMLDIDHFKRVNDTHGHAVGDKVLVALAECFRETLRGTDLPSRLGGEEFAVLLPMTTSDHAVELADRLRVRISEIAVPLSDGGPLHFTVSIGVATFRQSSDDTDRVLRRADEALYRAKNAGRNRVALEDQP